LDLIDHGINDVQLEKDIYIPLKMLHDYDVVHRDIKLDNILFCKKENRLKLIDFGRTNSTQTKITRYGTPGYLHHNMKYLGYHDVFFYNRLLPTFDEIVKFHDRTYEQLNKTDFYKQNDLFAYTVVQRVLNNYKISNTKNSQQIYKNICRINKIII
jgi:serine/threonine protein kinase